MLQNIKLQCPRCNIGKLIEESFILRCNNFECNLGYKTINNKYVIIDFDNSLINETNLFLNDGLSFKTRGNPFYFSLFKRLIYGDGIITKKNLSKLFSLHVNCIHPKILIIGGGEIGNGMENFYDTYIDNILSFDIYYSNNIDFIADAHSIPVVDDTFDVVIIQAVLEHVVNPAKVVNEIYRVLRNGGCVYAETPFLQNIHEGAYDFTRYTNSGHRYLFKYFECLDSGFNGGAGTSLMWSLSYFFCGLFRSYKIGRIARLFLFWLRFIDFLIPERFNLDSASGNFFIGQKNSNYKHLDSTIIKFYKGAMV
jgi:hypothetical protein